MKKVYKCEFCGFELENEATAEADNWTAMYKHEESCRQKEKQRLEDKKTLLKIVGRLKETGLRILVDTLGSMPLANVYKASVEDGAIILDAHNEAPNKDNEPAKD